MNDLTINIRNIQHYLYCQRRFTLLEINKDWSENHYVISANILHEHVHDGSHSFSDSKKVVRSDIEIYNDSPEYDLFGVSDCIEFIKDANGVFISSLNGNYKVCIVEYKPKAPKGTLFNETDAIQVFAQKICADYVWKCNSESYIYYADIRKRIKLPFDTEYVKYDNLLKKLLSEMREILTSHTILPRKRGQKCSGCSINDLCMPKTNNYCVKDIIMSYREEET